MLQGFLISCEKGGMEDRVNLALIGDAEVEGCMGDDFLHLKLAGSVHLELLGSIHVEVGVFKPDPVSHLPWSKLRGYSFLHFLLGHLVGSLSIASGCG